MLESCIVSKECLGDIENVQEFVDRVVRRWWYKQINTSAQKGVEYEEVLAEGMLLLYELWGKWDGRGTFSGYATRFLPFRLTDWWRKDRRQRLIANGKNLNTIHELIELDNPDYNSTDSTQALLSNNPNDMKTEILIEDLRALLNNEEFLAALMFSEGYNMEEIANTLAKSMSQVFAIRKQIKVKMRNNGYGQ